LFQNPVGFGTASDYLHSKPSDKSGFNSLLKKMFTVSQKLCPCPLRNFQQIRPAAYLSRAVMVRIGGIFDL
jgi:hypothetical protein